MLTQQKLNAVTSEKCNLSLVLFDEIEKAAPSMTRLLLGVLDKGVLRLGDNSSVNFEKSLVFLTSNLGAREMLREINPDFGFQSATGRPERTDLTGKLQSIGLVAVRKRFSPEFVNRIDCIITYQPLSPGSALGDSRSPDHRLAEPCQYAPRQPLVHAGSALRSAPVPAPERAPARSTGRAN